MLSDQYHLTDVCKNPRVPNVRLFYIDFGTADLALNDALALPLLIVLSTNARVSMGDKAYNRVNLMDIWPEDV